MMKPKLDALSTARLAKVMALPILSGKHPPPNGDFQACVMEVVSFVAGEPWSDAPKCTCPVIGAFVRSWNDTLPTAADRERLLKPLIAKLIGTKSTKKIEERRAFMAMDWTIRVFTPAWLDLTESLKPYAQTLRNLEEIADTAGLVAAGGRLKVASSVAGAAVDVARAAARDVAWYAARAAARAAARTAARAAAWYAVGDVARAAARAAAWDAAWDAAWYAAWAAAWDAAWYAAWGAARTAAVDAAGDAADKNLQPTVAWLQTSAVNLVERMCEVQLCL